MAPASSDLQMKNSSWKVPLHFSMNTSISMLVLWGLKKQCHMNWAQWRKIILMFNHICILYDITMSNIYIYIYIDRYKGYNMCIYKLQYINASFIVIPLVKEQVAGVQTDALPSYLGASGTTNKTPPKKSVHLESPPWNNSKDLKTWTCFYISMVKTHQVFHHTFTTSMFFFKILMSMTCANCVAHHHAETPSNSHNACPGYFQVRTLWPENGSTWTSGDELSGDETTRGMGSKKFP